MANMEFWFDFASTYSWLTASRIETVAERKGVKVAWRPILLGPIFKAQGLDTSPFNIYPIKGAYMWRDVARLAEQYGLPAVKLPDTFPQNSILAARVGLVALNHTWGKNYCRDVFSAEFETGAPIDDPERLKSLLEPHCSDPSAILEAAVMPENKLLLRNQTERATDLKIFGAPSFTTAGGELFWGDDRLEMALDWALDKG